LAFHAHRADESTSKTIIDTDGYRSLLLTRGARVQQGDAGNTATALALL
jgi:hypothetical protein